MNTIATIQIPATQNTTWGFYGSMSEHADTAWSLAMSAVSDATGQPQGLRTRNAFSLIA